MRDYQAQTPRGDARIRLFPYLRGVVLRVPKETLHRWRRVGWVRGRKHDDSRGRWILWADADEIERLRQLRACPRTWDNQPKVRQLIIPKSQIDLSHRDDR